MVHFVGAGSGASDLITVRGKRLIGEADVIIYAGSLVNPELLDDRRPGVPVYNSAVMTLEEVVEIMREAEQQGKTTVRLHTGDPCIYGAIREQMDALDALGIDYDVTPGVSSFLAAAAALRMEYTLPGVSQSVVVTRMEGRTPVPKRESIQAFAAHHASMAIFLSVGRITELEERLIEGGYAVDTPAAVAYKVSWPGERTFVCTVGTLAQTVQKHHITKTALILVGDAIAHRAYERSKLYDPGFTTEYRKESGEDEKNNRGGYRAGGV